MLAIIAKIGTAGGTGYAIEFGGQVFCDMSIEGRMTVCNMAIEGGARVGLVAVDDKTIDYVKDRPYAPTGDDWERAVTYWNTLHSDDDAHFDAVVVLNGDEIEPQVSWGTSPEMVIAVSQNVPTLDMARDDVQQQKLLRVTKSLQASSKRWLWQAQDWSKHKPNKKGWIKSLWMQALNGVNRAVLCALP